MSDLLIILAIVLTVVWVMGVVCLFSEGGIFGRLFHIYLGWHFPDDSPQTFDGLSIHARCKFCGKEILQDSQGNWFTCESERRSDELRTKSSGKG